MIKSDPFDINGKEFIRSYSDLGFLIERDGETYSAAEDPAEFNRKYTETDELIKPDMTETEMKAQAYDILMGVSE